jgi:pimeloyl-ACP methyl ester carboxylesterase
MPKTTVNGVNLHYIAVGAGPDVVMLHGFLGNLAVWHLQIAPQLRRSFRVTTYDLRGHGYSEVTPTGYTAGEMVEDLVALLDRLGIERAHLVGHSFGADICLYFALKYPNRVKKLVALEPGLAALVNQRKHDSWGGWSYWVSKLEEVGITVPEEKRTDLEFLLDVSLNTPKFYGPARGLPRNREPLLKLIRETTLLADYEVIGDLTLDAVRTIRTPTLLMYGDQSHFLSSFEVLRYALPNCKPVLLPGGEHFGPLEQPELLTAAMVDFLGTAEMSFAAAAPSGMIVSMEDGGAEYLQP